MVKLQEAPQVLATPTRPNTTNLTREIVMPVQLITTPCVVCEKPVFESVARRAIGRGKYCSRACLYEYAARSSKWTALATVLADQFANEGATLLPIQADSQGEAVQIPLRAKDGSVRAYALVDAADADWVNQWRWCLSSNGYVKRGGLISGANQQSYLHRELMDLGAADRVQVDHINRDKLDNRRSTNLRVVTRAENNQNSSSQRGSSSKYRGVYLNKKERVWIAQIKVNGKSTHVGRFKDEDEAGEAARQARLRVYPCAQD